MAASIRKTAFAKARRSSAAAIRRRRRAFQAPAARLVRPQRPDAAVARDVRSVPHPRVGNHAAADAGRSRAAEVPRVARQVSLARGARRCARTRCDRDLVSARLQHPAEAAAGDRARGGRDLRRQAAVGRSDAAVVQGHRRVHGRRDSQLRVPRARGDSRHQRGARAVSRVRRQRRAESARDEEAPVEHLGGARAAAAARSTSIRR